MVRTAIPALLLALSAFLGSPASSQTNTAVVTLLAQPDSVSVTIQPQAWSGEEGDTATFSCLVRNETTGQAIDRPCVYRSDHERIQVDSLTGLATLIGRMPTEETGLVVADTLLATAPPDPPSGEPFVYEDFERATLDRAEGAFEWRGGARVPVTDMAHTGSQSVRFVYGPDAPDEDSWQELRFNYGIMYDEVWLEYYLWMPDNYTHRNGALGGLGNNNKFLFLWDSGKYPGGAIGQIQIEIALLYNSTEPRTTWIHFGWGDADEAWGAGSEPFLLESDMGAWNQVRVYVKRGTTPGEPDDGVYRFWWNGRLIRDGVAGFYNPDPSASGWQGGYLLGFASSGYTDLTTFYVDDFRAWSSNPGWS